MNDYNVGGDIQFEPPGWADVMSSTPRLPKKEVLCQEEGTPRGGRRAVRRAEQKNVSRMKELVRKPSTSGDVVNFSASACSTAKVCVLHDQPRKLVGCGLSPEMLDSVETDPVLTFVSQTLAPKSDISGHGDVRVAAKFIKNERAATLPTTKASL